MVGVTNRPQDLDPALKRRFDKVLVFEKPDFQTRVQIFQKALKHVKKDKDFDYETCARVTAGYLSSDIVNLCLLAFTNVTKEHVQLLKAAKRNSDNKSTDISASAAENLTIPQRPMKTLVSASWSSCLI